MTSDNIVTDPSLYPRVPDLPPPGEQDIAGTSSARSNTKATALAGIVAAAALAVGIGVAVSSNGSTAAQAAGGQAGLRGVPQGLGAAGANAQGGTGTQAQGGAGTQAGQGFQGGPAGVGPIGSGGGQLVMGTVTAVSSSSITVKTAAATTTYTVSPTTDVIVSGGTGSITSVQVGSNVLVQVPTTGATTTATRILVGSAGIPLRQGQSSGT